MAFRSLLASWLRPNGNGDRPPDGTGASPSSNGHGTNSNGELGLQAELQARREEIVRMEERALRQIDSVETQLRDLERRRESLESREESVRNENSQLEAERLQHRREIERLAGMSRDEARQEVIEEIRESARRQAGLALRRIEEETRLEAERRARGILAVAMQRLASSQSSETTTRMVQLPNDEMKGRVIGREGRNIRALENLTGVDFIIDETPSAVVLSSFDGMRREVARQTLETLIADGRINPARCEEVYEQAVARVAEEAIAHAEEALLAAKVSGVHPEIVRLLGRLRYRTSYGQNVLDHLVESSNLAAMMAAEIGADVETTRRAAMLHDLGKAVSHEVEGGHAEVGARLARRYGESEAVSHAIEAHHNEVEPHSVEAVLVQAADALSGARPGARGESLEEYVSRLRDLEQIAMRRSGVKKVYAMRAGREIRVMVDPGQITDDEAGLISHEIATAIEAEMEYPGRIKVTVIRESRATSYAK